MTAITRARQAASATLVAPATRGRMSRKRWFAEVGWRYVVGIIALVFAAFPILYVLSASLNPIGSVVTTQLLPVNGVSLVNYTKLFDGTAGPFPHWYLNTLIVCSFVAIVQITASSLAAYAFSRLRFRGRRGGLLTLMLLMMFPNVLAMIAIYSLFSDLGKVLPAVGLSTIAGYCLALTGGALGQVWLIKGTLDSIPRELDEAATIDGAGHFQIFCQILLPILRPIIATTTLLAFVSVVSEFLIGSIFLTDPASKTLTIGLYGVLQADKSQNLGVFAAGSVLTMIPIILLFQFLQRYIVGDATSGAVKN